MQVKHPQAQLIRGHAVPTVDMQNSDGRYLLITPVTPEPDKTIPILSNPDILPGKGLKLKSALAVAEQCMHSYSELLRK